MIASKRLPVYWSVLLAVLLAGCVSSRYYLPTDPRLAVEEKASCTGAVYGYANLQLADGRVMRLTLTPNGNRLELTATVRLLAGQRLRLVEPTVMLHESTPDGPGHVLKLDRWESIVHGARGTVLHRDRSDSEGWIEGKAFQDHQEAARSNAFNLFTAKAYALAPGFEQYRVTLPPTQVNDTRIPARTFDVQLHENTSISRCVQ
jgi:hypothetical protein